MSATDDQPDEQQRDEQQLADRLVAFEIELAAGNHSTLEPERGLPDSTLAERLAAAKECVLLLEDIWPHARPLGEDLPQAIGRFRILRELGRGGFSIVYLAYDDRLGRELAIKVQRPEALLSATLRERFVREAKAAARLKHPHIAAVHEVGQTGLQVWIASEYVAGDSLAAWLRRQGDPVEPRAAAAFLVPLAEAVEFAHRSGVLHRDLKPSNVLLESIDHAAAATGLADFRPQLIDFGLAKLDEVARHHTRTGALIGTPPYMSPEQASGDVRAIGPATDVYGLGTILYELLTGRPPFDGANDVQTLRKVLDEDPAPPRKLRPEVPADLEAICLKCLAKQPERRYARAADLARDVARFLSGHPTVARPASLAERGYKWARRRPVAAAITAVGAAAAVAIAALTTLYVGRLRDAHAAAEASRLAAVASAQDARANEHVANQYLYASRMRLAQQAIDQGDIVQARQLVGLYAADKPLAALRGFEWHYLNRCLHRERHTLVGHDGEVYGVTFTPDGRQIVSAGQDGTIRFWDPATGRALKTFRAHDSCVNIVAYSPDGKLLASGSCDKTIKLWRADTLELVATLDGNPREVHCLAFHPTDSNLLAAGGHENGLAVWDLADRRVVHALPRTANTHGVAWSRDGGTLHMANWAIHKDVTFSGSWRLSDGHVTAYGFMSDAIAVSPDGDVCWGGNGALHRLAAGGITHSYPSGGTSHTVAFSPAGDLLASTLATQSICLWDPRTHESLQVYSGHTGRVQALAFSPTEPLLASASFDGTIKLWDYPPPERRTVSFALTVPDGDLFAAHVALSADLRYLAYTPTLDELCVYDLADGSRRVLPAKQRWQRLQFGGAGHVLYPVCLDGRLHAWDVAAWQSRFDNWLVSPERGALFHDTLVINRHAGTTLADSANVDGWRTLPHQPGADTPCYESPDGRLLLIDLASEGWILDAERPKQLTRVACEAGALRAICNDGTWTAQGSDFYTIAVVEVKTGQVVASLRHPTGVGPVAFSPDGRTLAVGSSELMLWNVANGQELMRMPAFGGGTIQHVRFSADGRHLAAVVTTEELRGIQQSPGGPVPSIDTATLTVTIYRGPE